MTDTAPTTSNSPSTTVAFVCVQNAGSPHARRALDAGPEAVA